MSSDPRKPDRSIADAVAQRVDSRRGEASPWSTALRELGAVDRATYRAIAETPTPSLDDPIRRLSNAANNSRLWLGIAAALAVLGGRRGRRGRTRGRRRYRRDLWDREPIGQVARRATATPSRGTRAVPFACRRDAGVLLVPLWPRRVGIRVLLRRRSPYARARGPGPAPRWRSRLLAGACRRPLPGRRYRGGDDGIGDCRDAFLARRSPRG